MATRRSRKEAVISFTSSAMLWPCCVISSHCDTPGSMNPSAGSVGLSGSPGVSSMYLSCDR